MKIMTVQLGTIGDLILRTAVFSRLKNKFPDAEIHVLASTVNESTISHNPFVDKVQMYNKSPMQLVDTFKFLRRHKYDYWIDQKDHYSTESTILAKIARATHKIGYNKKSSKVFDTALQKMEGMHFTEMAFKSLESLGIIMGDAIPRPELFIPEDSVSYTDNFLREKSLEDYIVVNISAGLPSRLYPTEKWAAVINEIEQNVVICHAPKEQQTAQLLNRLCPKAIIFKSRNILDVYYLLKKCRLLLTPDTALVHAASAFNKDIVGLYRSIPSILTKFRPLSDRHIVLKSSSEHSIAEISPADVTKSLKKLL